LNKILNHQYKEKHEIRLDQESYEKLEHEELKDFFSKVSKI